MKVLMISPTFTPDVGGVETMLKNLCSYLTTSRIETDVVTYCPLIVNKKAPFKEILTAYVTIWRIPWIGYGLFNLFEKCAPLQFFYLVPGLTLGVLLKVLLHRKRPDVIHAFGLSGAFAGGMASRIFGIPCVVDMCTVYRFPERRLLAWFVRRILNRVDYVRGNNPAGKQELINLGLPAEKIGMITPPVDETVFKPMLQTEARKHLGLPESGDIVLFVGRMVESKNVDLAVATALSVKRAGITFVFVGEGPLLHKVEHAREMDARIRIVGNAKHRDLVYFYNAADILLCAPVDAKLLAFVGREALMCGLPILAPNTAVYFKIAYKVDSYLVPQEIGRLLDPKPEAFAAAVNEFFDYKAARGASLFDRNACRQHALEHYSTRAMEWLEDVYQKASRMRGALKKTDVALNG